MNTSKLTVGDFMALWGISGSDLKNTGWNTAVGLGVTVGCATVAAVVKFAALFARHYFKPDATEEQKQTLKTYSTAASLAVGLGAAVLADRYIFGSRFALLTDPSIILKLAVVQGLAGFVLDRFAKNNNTPIFGLIGILSTLESRYTVICFGVLGTLLGSETINR